MPLAARRMCSHPGCKRLVPSGRCDVHQLQYSREDVERRGSFRERGYSSRWSKAARTYLARPENRVCRIRDTVCTTLATLVDHIHPWRSAKTAGEQQALFWDSRNWQPACASCHGKKTVEHDRERNSDGTFGRRKP